jgi:hypothetical protein
MEVPARFVRFSPSRRGVPSEEGWIEIDIKALDLDGVSKLYVNLSDVAHLRQKRDEAAKTIDAWDAAFGKKADAGKESSE